MGKFVQQINAFNKRFNLRGSQVMRKLGLDAYNRILRRSPVDEGRFRGSWRIGVNKIDGSVQAKGKAGNAKGTEFNDSPNGAEVSAGTQALLSVGFGDTIHITNNLPYAKGLEAGKSAQNNNRPDGIVGATFKDIRNEITSLIRAAKRL